MPLKAHQAPGALLERVPAFARARSQDPSFLSYDDDQSPYMLFGDFGLFMKDLLLQRQHSPEELNTLEQAFGLINDMASSPDDEVINLVQVGVFEVLAGEPTAVATAKQRLTAPALTWFEETLKWWGPNCHGTS